MMRGRLRIAVPALLASLLCAAPEVIAQEPPPDRALYAHIPAPPIRFDPPVPERHTVEGADVFYLHDDALPLVSVFARFRGGPSSFGRDRLAAATAVPQLLRSAGTRDRSADSVDTAMEFLAAETSFGGGGRSSFASVSTLTRNAEAVLDLWFELLREPAFDPDRVEVWRGREVESARRRPDNPGSLAVSTFNALMYGDHPVGWTMSAEDLTPERLAPEILDDVHGRIYCRENLTLGVAGALPWDAVRPLLEREIARFGACPEALEDPPLVDFRRAPGVYWVQKELPQSTVVLGQASDVHLGDTPEYVAAQIGNSILGASGFTSRLVASIRTERGLAYSVSSVWTTPRRSQGLLGAITQTRAERTAEAVEAIVEVFSGLVASPPRTDEVDDAISRITNGFVFNFESAAQIVSRQMAYRVQELPEDWLERYVAGLETVTAESVGRVIADTFRPEELVILVVGNPDPEDLARLGPVTRVDPAALPPAG